MRMHRGRKKKGKERSRESSFCDSLFSTFAQSTITELLSLSFFFRLRIFPSSSLGISPGRQAWSIEERRFFLLQSSFSYTGRAFLWRAHAVSRSLQDHPGRQFSSSPPKAGFFSITPKGGGHRPKKKIEGRKNQRDRNRQRPERVVVEGQYELKTRGRRTRRVQGVKKSLQKKSGLFSCKEDLLFGSRKTRRTDDFGSYKRGRLTPSSFVHGPGSFRSTSLLLLLLGAGDEEG